MKLGLAALGKELHAGRNIEIQLLGGAAAMLTGLLPGTMTTGDLDVVYPRPPGDVEEILDAAMRVADQQNLPRSWLNIEAGLFAHAIPDGWEARRVAIGTYGRLQVFALGRMDLIATKFFAHRAIDTEHLHAMGVTREEQRFVKNHLESLSGTLPDEKSRIEKALHILLEWL